MIRHALKPLLVLVLAAILTAPATAGWFDRGVKGNGDLTTTTYDLDDCDAIVLRCGLDVTVRFGDTQEIALTVDENLVEHYDIEARGGTLVIDTKKKVRAHRNTELTVTLTELRRLKISGAGDIEISDYDGDELDLHIDGAGDLEIDGRADRLEVVVNGAGDIDARRLECADAEVTINGAGDVSVHASQSADVTINGVGDIDVYGNPEQFAKAVNGVGDVDRK